MVSTRAESHDPSPSEWPILQAPAAAMLQKLREVDPAMAARWHPNDARKIRRSLEIYYQTGRRASDVYAAQAELRTARSLPIVAGERDAGGESEDDAVAAGDDMRFPTLLFWPHTSRARLRDRLRQRVDGMVRDGLIDEARTLHDMDRVAPIDTSRGIHVSIGYKEFADFLAAERDGRSPPEHLEQLRARAVEATKAATWAYAKRQEQWIRNRLAPALRRARAHDLLFVLDTDEPREWRSRVQDVAVGHVDAFLAGRAPWSNVEACPHYEETLAALAVPDVSADAREAGPRARVCGFCNVSTTTQREWDIHVSSRRHAKCIKGREKRARDEARLAGRVDDGSVSDDQQSQ